MKKAALIGFGIGLLPLPFCILLAGFGHGSMWPAFLFFGPGMLLMRPIGEIMSYPPGPLLSCLLVLISVATSPGLYAAYAVLLRSARLRRRGGVTAAVVTPCHYLAAGLLIVLAESTPSYMVRMLLVDPALSASAFFLLVGLNVLVVLYACDRMPRRLQFSLRSLFVGTFVIALTCGSFLGIYRCALSHWRAHQGRDRDKNFERENKDGFREDNAKRDAQHERGAETN